MRKKLEPLTEVEWWRVYNIRCKSKLGHALCEKERKLIDRAFAQDRMRYDAMADEIFKATAPFGSQGFR